jgi:hypothetical protein
VAPGGWRAAVIRLFRAETSPTSTPLPKINGVETLNARRRGVSRPEPYPLLPG